MTLPDPPPADGIHGPWNPGISSEIPRHLRHLATILRPEIVYTSPEQADELHDLTGLPIAELVAFRPERLALHEVLVRVTADLSVNDGTRVEDLGINFRRMVSTLMARDVEPRLAEVVARCEGMRAALGTAIGAELDAMLAAGAPAGRPGWLQRLGIGRGRADEDGPAAATDAGRLASRIAQWRGTGASAATAELRAARRALARVAGALIARHGRLWASRDLIVAIAADLAINTFGSREIGRMLDPWLREGAAREGYRLLPVQPEPVVMNTKGASASGKSTMRPLQRELAERIGVSWADFALISPDIWRKQLLDYATLGRDYRYAGALTGEELQIVDHKLDSHMAAKAQRGGMSHLLIDRFRFDSFAPESDEAGSNLLTRFGRSIYLFFMITPPAATVERAWHRGLEVGRYKAVDDLLAHNVEAYTGIPELLFTWALRADKHVHYELLDNSVALGETPRTVAFGENGRLAVLDVKCMLDVERFKRIDVEARTPEAVLPDPETCRPERNTGFLAACARRLPQLDLVWRENGRVYLRILDGRPAWTDREVLARAMRDAQTRAGVEALVPAAGLAALPEAPAPVHLAAELGEARIHTLGRWRTGS